MGIATRDLKPQERIILALNGNVPASIEIARLLSDHVGMFKIGYQLQTKLLALLARAGSEENAEYQSVQYCKPLFDIVLGRLVWDGKFNDTPDTIGDAVQTLADMRVRMLTIHMSSGMAAVREAVQASTLYSEERNHSRVVLHKTQILTVTVLSSLHPTRDAEPIFGASLEAKVAQFVREATLAGVDGFICSGQELPLLAKMPERNGKIVAVVGIRPAGSPAFDQERHVTPAEAIHHGADYLIVGRPILEANDPVASAKAIADEIASVHA